MKMSSINVAFVVSAMLMVAGCASGPSIENPIGISKQAKLSMRDKGVDVLHAFDGSMIKATRTKAVIGVLGHVLSGTQMHFGGKPVYSPIDVHEYGAWFDHAELMKLEGPGEAAAQSMRHHLGELGIPSSSAGDFSVFIKTDRWGLDYEKMTSGEYKFIYQMTFKLSRKGAVLAYYNCGGSMKKTASMDDWMKNDKALLRRGEAQVGDKCAQDAMTAFKLSGSDRPQSESANAPASKTGAADAMYPGNTAGVGS